MTSPTPAIAAASRRDPRSIFAPVVDSKFVRSLLMSVTWRVSMVVISCLLDDGETEHHSALVVLSDVAVSHPHAGVGDVEQDVDGLPGAKEHRVLPDEVGVRLAATCQDEEPTGAVDVERVVHRVVAVHGVDQADL